MTLTDTALLLANAGVHSRGVLASCNWLTAQPAEAYKRHSALPRFGSEWPPLRRKSALFDIIANDSKT